MRKINVLSLFDGMACGFIACKKAGININKYHSYEIDKYAIQIAQKNNPRIIQKGDIQNYIFNRKFRPDLILCGSPCQGFSKAGKGLNFKDERSKLFFDFIKILRHNIIINPKVKFLFENVKMKKEWIDIITQFLKVKPILLNSALVSAQNRERLYWTNIKNITQPKDKKIFLSDIIDKNDTEKDKSYCITANYFHGTTAKRYFKTGFNTILWKIPEGTKKGYVKVKHNEFIDLTFIKSKTRRGRLMIKKCNYLTKTRSMYCKVTKKWFRLLTPRECEKLQTLPKNYTKGVSNSQRYKMIGNGWTIDIISHILKNFKI